jgi:hypothetical protein
MKSPVVQLESTGCAIASVAAIAGISYMEMKSIANSLGIFSHDKNLWSETSFIRRMLDHVGLNADPGESPFHSWESLPDLALLAIKWHWENGRPFWHWVVFIRENGQSIVLDSKKGLQNNIRTDFGRMRPMWYIRVTEATKASDEKLLSSK